MTIVAFRRISLRRLRLRMSAVLALTAALAAAACDATRPQGVAATGSVAPITGCSNQTADGKPVTDAAGAPTQNLIDALVKGLAHDPQPSTDKQTNAFDSLLDCYVGKVDATNLEQRLYRGHVIVAMLAMYGSYNLRVRRYDGIEDHAATILKSISAAELALSRSSNMLYKKAGAKTDLPQTPLASFMRVDRAVDILQVAIDVERPTYGRVREGVFNLIAAIGGSPTAVQDLVKEALTALRKAAVLDVYGSALRTDAFTDLGRISSRGTVTVEDWEAWDRPLYDACQSIAQIAKIQNAACVPSAARLLDSFRNGPPSRG